ncbi:MAG TPA: hypothetical protein VFJ71_13165, partial [Candidatus Limnocylindrales bacterium]|nr:hypothetical protein [Candidatus Limnocylindrales bacterium]
GLTARPGDRVVVRVPADWLILRWEGSDHPLAGDAANVWPAVAVSDPGRQIDVPVPARAGTSIATYTLWVRTVDGRVVGSLSVLVRIRVAG